MTIIGNIEAGAAAISADVQAFLKEAGNLLAAGVATVAQAQQLLSLAASVTAKGQPDQTDWDALHAILDANTAALNAPLPE